MTKPQISVTDLIARHAAGDPAALSEAYSRIYDELLRIARSKLRGSGGTISPTVLVNEAYLKLLGDGAIITVQNRLHFVNLVGRAMRWVLMDHAKSHRQGKRGGGLRAVTFNEEVDGALPSEIQAIELSDALEKLAQKSDRLCRVIELRCFVGLSIEEAAVAMGVSPSTAKRDWAGAKAWLTREMGWKKAG